MYACIHEAVDPHCTSSCSLHCRSRLLAVDLDHMFFNDTILSEVTRPEHSSRDQLCSHMAPGRYNARSTRGDQTARPILTYSSASDSYVPLLS